MGFESELITTVAEVDSDAAIKGLVYYNNNPPPANSAKNRKLDWAHNLCKYSLFVHANTWNNGEPIETVKNKFIPEFEKAENSIGAIIKKKGFASEEIEILTHYKDNIAARKHNLIDNYCNHLTSYFEPATREPRLSKSHPNTS